MALRDYQNAIRRDPKKGLIYFNRAQTYFFMGKYPEALKDIQQSRSLGVDVPQSFVDSVQAKMPPR